MNATHNDSYIMSDSLSGYRRYLIESGHSNNTIRAYEQGIYNYMSRYTTLTIDNLMDYRRYLIACYKPRTINQRICAINSYTSYMHINMIKLKQVHINGVNYLDNVISDSDYIHLLSHLKSDGHMLFYFLIKYMATTGMRVSEVIQVECSDVYRGYVDVYAKGNKTRRVFFTDALRTETITWLHTIGRSEGSIFISSRGTLITDGGIRAQLRLLGNRYDISSEVMHPHVFRHFFAKHFIDNCHDISVLADILGHSNIETTRIYLRRTKDEQHNLINQVVNW